MLDVHTPGSRGAAALVVAALVVAAGVPVATADSTARSTQVSGCQTIESPGIYEVTANVTDAPRDGCIVVAADGVVLSGNGHLLATANGTGPGVLVADAERVSVHGLTLDGWETGVAYRGVDGGGVLDLAVRNASTGVGLVGDTTGVTVDSVDVRNTSTGVNLAGDGDSVVSRSTFVTPNGTGVAVHEPNSAVVGNDVSNASTGLRVADARDVRLVRNAITNADVGVAVDRAGGVTVNENVLNGTRSIGVLVQDAPLPAYRGPAFDGGVARFGAAAFQATDAAVHAVTNNSITGANDYGVLVVASDGATVDDNSVVDVEDGIAVSDTDDVRVAGNDVAGSGDDGVVLSNADRSVVAENLIEGSGDDGVYVLGDRNRIANNTLANSTDDGVDVQNSTLPVLAGNDVAGSGDDGLFLRNATDATVSGNSLTGNADDGVDLRAVTDSTVLDNRLCDTGEVPIVQRRGAGNNTVANNTVGC